VCEGCGVCGVCGVCGGVGVKRTSPGPLLTFDIPQTALVATLDTYDFIVYGFNFTAISQQPGSYRRLTWHIVASFL
jgi:hypothetical protein